MEQIKIDIHECFSTIPCGCNARLAEEAYRNISFVPEKRARQELDGTQQDIVSLFDVMATYITPETKEDAFDAFAEYVARYTSKYNAYLRAKSSCVSWMITGRSGLNVIRANKANDRERRLYGLFTEWRAKAFKGLLKRVFGVYATSGIVQASNPDAIHILQAKLDRLESKQAEMKAINKAFSRFSKDSSLAEFFEAQGIEDESVKRDIYANLSSWARKPFPPFQLTNNNAKIKSTRERIERLEKYQEQAKSEDVRIGDVTLARNKELVRLQIFFPGKPDQETIKELKRHGFRWSPSQSAWQRQDTNSALYDARNIIKAYNDRQAGGAR